MSAALRFQQGMQTVMPSKANTSVRPPAVAGYFYPKDPAQLKSVVEELIAAAAVPEIPTAAHAYIVPHAGYPYSGPIAAVVYAAIAAQRSVIRRVVVVGPSHRAYVRGVALPRSNAFATPLGVIPIDRAACRMLSERGDVIVDDAPHASEHSLEVQLPFLQTVLDEFELVPLLGGDASADHVGSLLEQFWGDETTLVLASSDLSHYHAYDVAQRLDATTSAAILRRAEDLQGDQACGAVAINGLMNVARTFGCKVSELVRLNSGDTAGDRARVVGYGAFAVHDRDPNAA